MHIFLRSIIAVTAPLFLSSCIGNGSRADLPSLAPITQIKLETEVETKGANKTYFKAQKTLTNPTQIATIAALLDKQRSNFRSAPGGISARYSDIALSLRSGANEQRKVVISRNGWVDQFGKEWNISAADPGAAQGNWVCGQLPDADLEALIAALGSLPTTPPKAAPAKVVPAKSQRKN